jgi:hypothetical protein
MVERDPWITQTKAAELRGMTLKAINALVLRGRIRSKEVYGRTLVHRDDVLNYEPKTKNRFSAGKASKKGQSKSK